MNRLILFATVSSLLSCQNTDALFSSVTGRPKLLRPATKSVTEQEAALPSYNDSRLTRLDTSLQISTDASVRATVNVRDFGATGDGVKDDSEAIQAALTVAQSGGTVLFPPGSYLIERSVGLERCENIKLVGSGATILCRAGNTIRFGPTSQARLDEVMQPTNSGIEIEGLSFKNWPSDNNPSNFISIAASSFVTIRDCRLQGFLVSGIVVRNGSEDIHIDSCSFQSSGNTNDKPITVSSYYSSTYDQAPVDRDNFREKASLGAMPRTVRRVKITDCSFLHSFEAIIANSSEDIVIEGNHFYGITARGINLSPNVRRTSILNNQMHGGSMQSTHINLAYAAQQILIQGNVFLGGGAKGINAYYGCKDVVIKGNSFFDDTRMQVLIAAASSAVIDGNIFRGTNTNRANIWITTRDWFNPVLPAGTDIAPTGRSIIQNNILGGKVNCIRLEQVNGQNGKIDIDEILVRGNIYENVSGVAGDANDNRFAIAVSTETGGTVTWRHVDYKTAGNTDISRVVKPASGSGTNNQTEWPVSITVFRVSVDSVNGSTITHVSGPQARLTVSLSGANDFVLVPRTEGGGAVKPIVGLYPFQGCDNIAIRSTNGSNTICTAYSGGVAIPNSTSKTFHVVLSGSIDK